MSDFYCDICYKTIKLKNKKNHLNTRKNRYSSTSVLNRYCVKNPSFPENEDLLKNTFMIILKSLIFILLYVSGNWILITLSSA